MQPLRPPAPSPAVPAPIGGAVRRRRLLSLVTVLVLALSLFGCRLNDLLGSLSCTEQDVAFPSDERVIGGSWEGVATPASDDLSVLAVALSLDVEFVSDRVYEVRGELVVDDGAPLRVDGRVGASCWQRFVLADAARTGSGGGIDSDAEVDRTLSPPPPSLFMARLIDGAGAEVGTVSIELSRPHRMLGPLRLHDRDHVLDVEREPLVATAPAR